METIMQYIPLAVSAILLAALRCPPSCWRP